MILDWVSGVGLLIIALLTALIQYRNMRIAQAKNKSEVKKTESDLESAQITDAKALGNFAMSMFRQTQDIATKWEAKATELQQRIDDSEKRHSEEMAVMAAKLATVQAAAEHAQSELEKALAENTRLTEENTKLLKQILVRKSGTRSRKKILTDEA